MKETTSSLRIEIPMFIEKYKLSESRRAEYFSVEYPRTSAALMLAQHELPKKYRDPGKYMFVYYKEWGEYRLVDTKTKVTVTRNIRTVGKPYWTTIAGNDVWAKMNEFTRIKMVKQMKAAFKPYLAKHKQSFKNLVFPVLMTAEMHTTPKMWDWDLSNKWIYTKVFEDLLQDLNLIPNDNIQYITLPAAFRYIPIKSTQQRLMVFKFETDTDPRVTSHILYKPGPGEFRKFNSEAAALAETGAMRLHFTKFGESGNLIINLDLLEFTINVGKRGNIKADRIRGLFRTMYIECVNMNSGIIVSEPMYIAFKTYFDELQAHGLPTYVYEHTEEDTRLSEHASDSLGRKRSAERVSSTKLPNTSGGDIPE